MQVSVIIPIYNVAEFLPECIDSVLQQQEVSTEIILIDDGSTDGSDKIVDEYVVKDKRCCGHHIPNSGLGHARNYGARLAHGKYLFFVDSDDILVEGVLSKLVKLAERDESDMAICNVARFNSMSMWRSELHEKAFIGVKSSGHVLQDHELINDTTAWNKLIRRDFFERSGIQFGENMLYEDIPATLPLHLCANKVSILHDIGYLWRVRDGASRSITQRTSSAENCRDRIKALKMLDRALLNHKVTREFLNALAYKKLTVDLRIFVDACCRTDDKSSREMLAVISDYLNECRIDGGIFRRLPSNYRSAYREVQRGNLGGVRRALGTRVGMTMPPASVLTKISVKGTLVLFDIKPAFTGHLADAWLLDEISQKKYALKVTGKSLILDISSFFKAGLPHGDYRIVLISRNNFKKSETFVATSWDRIVAQYQRRQIRQGESVIQVEFGVNNSPLLRFGDSTRFPVVRHEAAIQKRACEVQKLLLTGTVLELTLVIPNTVIGRIKEVILFVDNPVSATRNILARSVVEVGQETVTLISDFSCPKVNEDLYESNRDLRVSFISDGGDFVYDVCIEKDFDQSCSVGTLNVAVYRLADSHIRLALKKKWMRPENCASAIYRKRPLKPMTVIFESMWGTKYSCNPMALYEYIDRNHPEFECVWSLVDERFPIRGRGKRVRRGSKAYCEYLATAGFLVNNVNFEDNFIKRPGQIEIQTMHGTPLKTLGLEVADDFPTPSSRELYLSKCHRWDYLITQGKFVEGKAKDMFDFSGQILRTGYPRTDQLFNKDINLNKLKAELGIRADRKVILYAPTWRVRRRFDMKLDLEMMKKCLGDEYVLLFKAHHLCQPGVSIESDGDFVIDLTKYRSIEDLYSIADVLITDYSSAMFDFALLDKPMLFFTYDFDEYCNSLRGLYVDFQEESPGPLLRTTEDVVEALKNLPRVISENKERTRKFKEKYLTYEGENSCKLIVEEMLRAAARRAENPPSQEQDINVNSVVKERGIKYYLPYGFMRRYVWRRYGMIVGNPEKDVGLRGFLKDILPYGIGLKID